MIVLIDKDNQHGRLMRYIIKPPLEYGGFSFVWERLDNNLQDILNKYKNAQGVIFCIPLSWTTENYNEQISNLAINNKVFAPFDSQNFYPWSLNNVMPIFKSTTMVFDIGDRQFEIDGNSVTCALAALEAQKKEGDT